MPTSKRAPQQKSGAPRRRSKPTSADRSGPTLYRLRVELSESDPLIWREIQVPGEVRLDRLHGVLQAAMGWCENHRHVFIVGETTYGDPDALDDVENECDVCLEMIAAEPGDTFMYIYDLGDDWQHELWVQDVRKAPSEEPRYRCLAGAGACPPEDCGGIWGYEELLEALRDPHHVEHETMLELAGGKFDPLSFDLDRANRRLQRSG